ncbi:MAG: 3-methylornithine--L-lysine ligase PylC [Desulfobacterium sp.]
MIVAIAGGNLQGVEATYLASKAGWTTLVVDRRPRVPASDLCDHFFQLDVTNEEAFLNAIKGADFILPALENQAALTALVHFSQKHDIPLAFDTDAYAISSSKVISDTLFQEKGIPAPLPWPQCGFPAMGKPDSDSGSHGITLFHNSGEYDKFLEKYGKRPDVLQEYVEGPSYSMEVFGMSGKYIALQNTQLFMDDVHDCCRVTAPVPLSRELNEKFVQISLDLARAVNLKGIMDVEVILHKGCLKVLEIDARLPSQTPTAVFHSTGINMVSLLGDIFVHKSLSAPVMPPCPAWVSYEHVSVSNQDILCRGEHIMGIEEPLNLVADLFGADEVLSNYREGKKDFVATLITTASSAKDLEIKRQAVFHAISEA